MDPVAASITAWTLQQAVYASHLQMALLKQRIQTEARGLLILLEAAGQAAANPPYLGSRVDTDA
ncbi:MAG: hypothetical protein ACK4TK_05955 [Thiobacillaceae bacterium]